MHIPLFFSRQHFSLHTGTLALLLGVALAMSGCGSPGDSRSDAKKPAGKKTPADKPKIKSPAAKPVKADFASIDEALETLKASSEKNQQSQMKAAYEWVVARKDEALPQLSKAIADESAHISYLDLIGRALSNLGPDALPALNEAYQSEKLPVRLIAINSLASVRPTNPEIVGKLAVLLDSDEPQIQVASLRSLARIGKEAKSTSEKIQTVMYESTDGAVRQEAAAALKKVDPRRTLTD